eukprot:GEZU01020802.1.p1 GENE.GEZU01020802.1~~GEZU01020802.1.p1  ORF type:complete len:528 (+),score=100.53 GEZU01020802.1:182-1765(+)
MMSSHSASFVCTVLATVFLSLIILHQVEGRRSHSLLDRHNINHHHGNSDYNTFNSAILNANHRSNNKNSPRQPSPDVLASIKSNSDDADRIINAILNPNSTFAGQAYERLALMTDTFGHRLVGSQSLEMAIDFILKELEKDGLENVHGEECEVPHWIRGNEYAVLLSPRPIPYRMSILGLGNSVGTDSDGITAEVLVVESFDELHQRAAEAKGKIVVFNAPFTSYAETARYRFSGAAEAAKVGAVAALVRSVTPFSIYSPHTGMMSYGTNDASQMIPTACITVEDSEMLARMQRRQQKIVLQLVMDGTGPVASSAVSRNVVAEIVGSEYPEEVVIVSGHIDSWDVGQGAMDDGAGAYVAWQALSVINKLGLRPKRTLRVVMWTSEEFGGQGGAAYAQAHKSELSNVSLAIETDIGTFTPTSWLFSGSNDSAAFGIVQQIASDLLSKINVSVVSGGGIDGTDVDYLVEAGVPGLSLEDDYINGHYFWFHHTNGDTMTVLDPHQMDLCAAALAVMSYTVANLDTLLPRN